MSPTWGYRKDDDELIEARRIQAEIAEAAGMLTTVAARLQTLVAELNEEVDSRREDEGA